MFYRSFVLTLFCISFASAFCEENLGTKYVEARTPSLEKSYHESNSTTPMFFILSPGVDPLKVSSHCDVICKYNYSIGTVNVVKSRTNLALIIDEI